MRRFRPRTSNERDYSADFLNAMVEFGWQIIPEHRNSKGRVDFLIIAPGEERLAVELKVKGTGQSAIRQLAGYLETGDYDQGIVVTAKPFPFPPLIDWECEDGTIRKISIIETQFSCL